MGRQQLQSLAEFVKGLNGDLSPAVVEVVTVSLIETLKQWNPYFSEDRFRNAAHFNAYYDEASNG